MMFIAYSAGNIIGPFLFFPSEAPLYPVSGQQRALIQLLTCSQSGFLATTVCFAFSALMIIILRVLLARENQRRDRLQGSHNVVSSIETDDLALTNETDKENLNFRYVI